MITFLHSLGTLFGVIAIGFAVGAVVNLVSACTFPKSMVDEAWPYAKKCYIFLGLMLLSIVIGALLMTI